MAEEVAKVAQRCEEAKHSKNLVLSNCGLRKFPDAVYFILSGVEIRTLSLAHNQFPRIPSKLPSHAVFTSITYLDISHNSLSALPDTMASLASLIKLDLSHNQFLTLPAILLQLTSLEEIDLSCNKVQLVEPALLVTAPPTLRELDLTSNDLTADNSMELEQFVFVKF